MFYAHYTSVETKKIKPKTLTLKKNLFLAMLGLPCYTGFSLVVVGRGCSSLWCAGSHCSGFSSCRTWALGVWDSVVVSDGLSSCGLQSLELRLSSCGAQI